MKVFTTKEAAEMLRYNTEYLRQKVRLGEIKAIKVGKKWLITEETIKEILGG